MIKSIRARRAGGLLWLVVAAGLIAPIGTASAATAPGNFRVNTTEDLVSLCATEPASPHYVAAIHFCHGFASGAYRYYEALATASPEHRYVCPTDPPPSRDQAIAGFVAWARSHPQSLGEPPVESLFRFLAESYPCAK
ncbi:MAG: Rap1a/Tai family immunity protein [Alphaproteobacteria bacterium]